MSDLTETQLAAAEWRGRALLAAEPSAIAAHYDTVKARVVVELANGCSYAIPAALIQDLQGAPPELLGDIVVDGAGLNLHWRALDVDLYVPALVSGIFGTRAWMARELARATGRAMPPGKPAGRGTKAKAGRTRKVSQA